MDDRAKQMPGLILVGCIFGAAIIGAGILRINRFVQISDPEIIKQTAKVWPEYKIDINSATASKLELLPAIGSRLAQRIIDYRRSNGRFLTLDDLQQVSGIGARSIERLRLYAEVSSDAAFSIAKHSPANNLVGDHQQPIHD